MTVGDYVIDHGREHDIDNDRFPGFIGQFMAKISKYLRSNYDRNW
jgi:hypothetical protein